MKPFSQMTDAELTAMKADLTQQFEEVKGEGLSLDMSRGKPSKAQLDLSMGMMDVLNSESDYISEDGVDCRNYGGVYGIQEARQLMADLAEVPDKNILIYGNSSLNIMFDTVARGMSVGIMGNTPWGKLDEVKFLCPVPGYDRHFGVTEFFGITMVNVPMLPTGPDMDIVEKLVSEDPSIKGIWCVPKYSNPTGISYSDETVRRFARLKPAAPDFRIYWDNAYTVHHLYYEDGYDTILELVEECAKAGNPDLVLKFVSTSKISFPGSGIAALAASEANIKDAENYLKSQTICFDKVNQLRHARYFKDMDGIQAHMKKHADIIRPKFQKVDDVLEKELGSAEIGTWSHPKGGYFISFEALPGCAKAIVAKAKEAGVVMTPAGATYPYGKDPTDSNIRIAPTFPTVEELERACDIFVLSVKLISIDKILSDRKAG